ncbi:MAG: transketolase [Anaerolineales bacterium]|nr:transketolase [Anaerolineales bacterium]
MTNIPSTYDKTDQLIATTLRMLAVDAIQEANSGHPGLPLGAADIATVLWTRFLKNNPSDPLWPDRDRFVLSAGHGSALLYALLHLSGYPLGLDEVKNFRQWGSRTAGHPEYEPDLGIEVTTGPLGQGISNAVGLALAEQWLAARFNKPDFPIVDHYTYVLAGDGDLMEGVSHEACSLAGHLSLSKLIVFFDDNSISIDGNTSLTRSTDVLKRFEAYGWQTLRADGHDMASIDEAIRAAHADAETEQPTIIACKTHIGYGSPGQDTAKVHGTPLGDEGLNATKEHFGWPTEPRFHIPEESKARFAEKASLGAEKQEQWKELLEKYRQEYPDLAAQWDAYVKGELPAGWEEALPDFSDSKPLATRATSGQVLDAIAPVLPTLLGGSADLTGSNKTKAKSQTPIAPDDFNGDYIHYGIREHGMGAIMNGLALHGLRPYGGTFLVFADYLRPTIRMAAMMGLPVIYIFSHDSIGLGEDGPTHQPVEQLASLRIIPNLLTLRPADGNETSQAWKAALERVDGPTALVLTRQGLPQVTPSDNDLIKGAYVLSEPKWVAPEIVLIATGSEVEIVLDAKAKLADEGIDARVVSMPSWELFDAQTDEYRLSVLPPDTPRLAIETGVSLGWSHYVGPDGAVIGLDRFGASAPYQTIYEEFGFTAENVVEKAKEILGK